MGQYFSATFEILLLATNYELKDLDKGVENCAIGWMLNVILILLPLSSSHGWDL